MDPIQQEMASLQRQIAAYDAEIVQLEAEVGELREELQEFEARYDAVVGPVIKRIDAVKAAIDDLEKLQRQQRANGAAPDVESLWRSASASTASAAQSAQESVSEAVDDLKSAVKSKAEKLKELYRKLARRYHPDYGVDEADRERRTQLMTIINEAYQNNDLETLKELDNAPQPRLRVADYYDSAMPLENFRLKAMRKQVRDLGARVDLLKLERSNILHNDLFDLKIEEKMAQSRGRDLLQEIAADMEAEYWEYMARLDALRGQINR